MKILEYPPPACSSIILAPTWNPIPRLNHEEQCKCDGTRIASSKGEGLRTACNLVRTSSVEAVSTRLYHQRLANPHLGEVCHMYMSSWQRQTETSDNGAS